MYRKRKSPVKAGKEETVNKRKCSDFCTQMFVRQIIVTPQLCPPPLGFGAAAPGGKLEWSDVAREYLFCWGGCDVRRDGRETRRTPSGVGTGPLSDRLTPRTRGGTSS